MHVLIVMGRVSFIFLCVLMITIPLTGCMSENESNNNNDSDVNPVNNYYFYNNTTIIEPTDGLTANQTDVSDTINNFNNSTYSDYYNYTTLLNNYTTLLNNYTTLQEQYNYSYSNYTNNTFYNYTTLTENQIIYTRGGLATYYNNTSQNGPSYLSHNVTVFETSANQTIQILSAYPAYETRNWYGMRLYTWCGLSSNKSASLENITDGIWGLDFQGNILGNQAFDPDDWENNVNMDAYTVPFYLPNPPSTNGCQHMVVTSGGPWSISYIVLEQINK